MTGGNERIFEGLKRQCSFCSVSQGIGNWMKNVVCILPSDFTLGVSWLCDDNALGVQHEKIDGVFLAKHGFLKWNKYGKH